MPFALITLVFRILAQRIVEFFISAEFLESFVVVSLAAFAFLGCAALSSRGVRSVDEEEFSGWIVVEAPRLVALVHTSGGVKHVEPGQIRAKYALHR
ncbi:hypothetical protein BD779DRAFT_1159604 [Infundibulicybe gibba]|nr:hypothetical protein BD779DRAFT_1159604 [Infundibulicybe gibba]